MFLENITQQQIQEFRQAFALFDKDGDGAINNKQLKTVLRSLGHNPTKEQLDIFITLIDQDKSGTIDFRQFLILISQRLNEKTLFDEIVQSFKVFDRDGDGFLTRNEACQICINQGIDKIQKIDIDDILDEVQNNEGLIPINQYVSYLIAQNLNYLP